MSEPLPYKGNRVIDFTSPAAQPCEQHPYLRTLDKASKNPDTLVLYKGTLPCGLGVNLNILFTRQALTRQNIAETHGVPKNTVTHHSGGPRGTFFTFPAGEFHAR